MAQSNRPELKPFNNPNEKLYRRFPPSTKERKYFQPDNKGGFTLTPMALALPRCSVNRQSLSEAADVINKCIPPKPDYGIAAITVDDARYRYKSSQGIDYVCDIEYLPKDEHKSHAEIQVFLKRTSHACALKLSAEVKKQIRTVLAPKFRVSKFPHPQ